MYHLILKNNFVSSLVFQEKNSYMLVSVGRYAPRYNIIIPDSKHKQFHYIKNILNNLCWIKEEHKILVRMF